MKPTIEELEKTLRDRKFWYTPHGKDRPMRHEVAARAAAEITKLHGVIDSALDEGYISNEWLQRALEAEG